LLSVKAELELIKESYSAATKQPFTNNATADFVRRDLPEALKSALENQADGLMFRGSAGQGKWTDTPWVAIMDPLVTTTTQRGYYVAYLFVPSTGRIVLSLQQGITELREGMAAGEAKEQLLHGAALIRLAVPEHRNLFSDSPIDLKANGQSSRTSYYEAAHAFGLTYDSTLPLEDRLVDELKSIVRLYRLLTYRRRDSRICDVLDCTRGLNGTSGLRMKLRKFMARSVRLAALILRACTATWERTTSKRTI